MAPVTCQDPARLRGPASHRSTDGAGLTTDSHVELADFEAELKRLSAANQELLSEFQHQAVADATDSSSDDVEQLRTENAALKARIEALEAVAGGNGVELWQERQREYEMLLEEKSEVIRGLHQKIQEMQESVDIGGAPAPMPAPTPSGTRLGQAEEILRLKRDMEEQRKQLEQDERDMMDQMRQMELQMAKERAEMARQKQEMQRLQADLTREIEQSTRNPELRERLSSLRRKSDSKQEEQQPQQPQQLPQPQQQAGEQKSSSFFRKIFG